MQMDGQELEPTLTPEQEAEADAAFNSGFDTTRAETSLASGTVLETDASGKQLVTNPGDLGNTEEDPAAVAAAAEAARVAAEADAAAKAQAEANAPVTISKADLAQMQATLALVPQLQAELTRTRDTTAGKLGSLKQTLDAVQAQAARGQAPTIKQMKRLEAEFPELAQLLTADLSDAFGSTGEPAPAGQPGQPGDGTAGGDPLAGAATHQAEPLDPLADPRVQSILREQSQKVVDATHPDWRDLAKTPEFKEWRTSLPPAAQQLLATSWNHDVLVPAFNDFKGWQQKRAETAQAGKQRDKRLEHGVPATTGRATGANAVDEDAAFLSGFNSARK